MPLLNVRELLPFPNGDNTSHTIINGVDFNLTALKFFNYTIYSNNTISNRSKCYLIFDQFKPHMFSNGSWVNGSTCYIPYYGIKTRGYASIAFGTAFGMSIMFTLINLRKHGKRFVREDKRFRIVGRRWQWYWMLFAAACGMISCLTGIDVDRNYLQDLSIILQSFFFTLMVPGTLAMVWESVRHWGSWQERQLVDVDPYSYPDDDTRTRTEFWLPLMFYLIAWLNFFMTIPRSWNAFRQQNTPEQQRDIAAPAATNNRTKAGAIIAAVAWFIIVYSLWHSLKHYKRRNTGFFGKINGFCRDCPTKLFVVIILLAVRVAYGLASAWIFELTIMKDDVMIGWPFGLGYGPILAIIIVFEVFGYIEENEDKVIMEQRRLRGIEHDRELNLTKKPGWWNKNFTNRFKSDDERLRDMAAIDNSGATTTTTRRQPQNIEMGDMTLRNRSRSRPPEDPFRDQSSSENSRQSSVAVGARLDPSRTESDAASAKSGLTGRTLTAEQMANARPQNVRSMLDV
ncbi:hypothetical protein BU24DRAFT_354061 [Aaosphaeria arxii CBS 175.79]|uniref:Uncharacterized protein n=1 Tax=Aaosphaeria arxii CBS 175.79 TaxID=1450172 RepID=A0A6A5XFS6_9PLEO|nr:uncharacterized protein BU24DRAFT_354061 [Aaosphaeria arxii CBS 175.79]KAF2011681.1 hypothetical protein BU24DRAFT_354061 [Aaosphaeria arxii CBS 175.79]